MREHWRAGHSFTVQPPTVWEHTSAWDFLTFGLLQWDLGHFSQCLRERPKIARKRDIVITLPRHQLLRSCVTDLCFYSCEKGTPGSVWRG